MHKRLLIGPAGSGKTHLLLDEFEQILRLSMDPLAEDHFFVLPSAEHTERIISMMLQRGVKGFFHRRVTTLSRLIADVFPSGENRIASNVTRSMLLRDVLSEKTWDYFSGIQSTPGFLDLALSFISELKEALIPVADFRTRMNRLKKTEPELASKYEALAEIYERYESRMKEAGFRDRQDMLQIFREIKKRDETELPRFKKIWLDGFFDFSNLQMEYLQELSGLSDQITVTLTKDPGASRPGLFDVAARTEKILKDAGFDLQIMNSKNYRAKAAPLVFLEQHLFEDRKPAKPAPGDCETVSLFEAVGVQGEVEMIAREILRLYRRGSFRFSDFAILLRRIGSYESVIRSVFARFSIPVEIHERERLKLSPMIQTVVTLLKIFRNGWKRADVLNFLKSSYVVQLGPGFFKNYEWIGKLEHAALREGILHSREEWIRRWSTEFSKEEADSFHEAKVKAFGPILALEDALQNTEVFPEIKKILFKAVCQTFSIFQIRNHSSEFVRRDAASFKRLEAILDEIGRHYELRDAAPAPFDEVADYFFRLVDLDLYSLHDRNRNRVQVYDVSLARQKEYRVVFVAGLLEKNFPIHVKEDPVLSDWERRLLNAGNEIQLREKLPSQNIERYLFYLAVTRAHDRLILTCPKLDLEGKEALPSFYLEEVKSVLGENLREKKQDLAHPYPPMADAVNFRELEISVTGQLWHTEPFGPDEEPLLFHLMSRFLANESRREKFQNAFQEIRAELTHPAIREGNYFRTHETSPTRLEEYAKCPYKYFAGRVLKLKDPEEETNFKSKGSILHKVLENYFQARSEGRRDLLGYGKAYAFMLQELDLALAKYPLIYEKKYQAELDHEELADTLKRFLEVELARLETSQMIPTYFEFSFGNCEDSDAPPLEIRDGERIIQINGAIDRVDVDSDKQYGMVLDYKRSAQFKRGDLELGISLQLPVYLEVVERFLKLKPVGGQLYSLKECKASGFYHDENAAGFDEISARAMRLSESEYREVIERSMDYIRRFTRRMANIEIPVKPRFCDPSCSYSAVCRIEKWKLTGILEDIKKEDKELKNSSLRGGGADEAIPKSEIATPAKKRGGLAMT